MKVSKNKTKKYAVSRSKISERLDEISQKLSDIDVCELPPNRVQDIVQEIVDEINDVAADLET